MSFKDKKELARSLYVKTDLYQKDICQKVGTTPKTLRKWIKEYGWEDEKQAESITRNELLQEAYKQLAAVNKEIKDNFSGVPDKKLSDVKGQLRKEIETLSIKPLHKYIEVLQEVIDWGRKKGRPELSGYIEFMNDFIQELAKEKNV